MPSTYKQVFKKHRKLLAEAPAKARNEAGALFIYLVVPRVPVATGRARGNWRSAVGTISDEINENQFDPSGTQTPRRIRIEIGKLPKEGSLVISNVLPYIERLNNGSSAQSPTGFLEVSAQDVSRVAPKLLAAALKAERSQFGALD